MPNLLEVEHMAVIESGYIAVSCEGSGHTWWIAQNVLGPFPRPDGHSGIDAVDRYRYTKMKR